jgi:hypothetical protein
LSIRLSISTTSERGIFTVVAARPRLELRETFLEGGTLLVEGALLALPHSEGPEQAHRKKARR